MREGDQSLGAFGNRSSLQVDHAVLGDDVHHVRARRRDDVAGREVEHDPALALAALLVGGRQADERLAALRCIGAAHKLQLASGAADVAMAVGFRRRLALQVHLRRVVDRDHLVVLHDDVRQVGVVDRVAAHVRVAVGGRVQARAIRARR